MNRVHARFIQQMGRENAIIERWNQRLESQANTKGIVKKRLRLLHFCQQHYSLLESFRARPFTALEWQYRLGAKRMRAAERLAKQAGLYYDEHGYKRGDYLTTRGLDFVPYPMSAKSPYCDMGREGLGLVLVNRVRIYPQSSRYRPSYAQTRYLVGKNESGTYFAHAVSSKCDTVQKAVSWIWGGVSEDIIVRQGDIALVRGRSRVMPQLPQGHVIDVDRHLITHQTHPPIPLPGVGQYIIVGQRAHVRVSEETRD